MRKLILLCFCIAALLTSSAQLQKRDHDVSGTLSGFADNTKVYLHYVASSKSMLIDSTLLVNGNFYFKGSLEREPISRFMVAAEDLNNYKLFWMETGPIVFSAEKGKFKEAVITGSKTQSDQDAYAVATKNDKSKLANIEFIRQHPNSIVSANVLSVYATTWGKDTTAMAYALLSKENQASSYGKNVEVFLSLNKNVKVGDRFVDFQQQDTEGKMFQLASLKGKVTLLEFWGSWCGPCRKNNPELVKIYNEFKKTGFEVVGVAADETKEDWLGAVKKDGLPWINVSDLRGDKNRVAMTYGISYYPTNFLIGKDGVIVGKDLHGDELRKKLEEVLK